jgi:acyl-CoA thioesterase-1
MSRLIVFLLSIVVMVAAPAATRAADAPTILVFGDSLSAGYGIDPARGWVSLLDGKLRASGHSYRVINASVSGETTAGGLARLPRALQTQHPALVILELGGNDGLRALPIAAMRDNLARMIRLCKDARLPVLLLGIRMPANYGPRFTAEFAAVYSDLARQLNVPLLPFLLEDIATQPALMQADGIHPNEQGQPLLLENVWPVLQKMLAVPARKAR